MMSSEPSFAPLVADVFGLRHYVGKNLGPTSWHKVTQEEVNSFADLTRDHNPIHVDPKHAAATLFGGTIVHGYFTIALLAPLLGELLQVEGASLGINYGLDRVRFPAPLPVGAELRTWAELMEVQDIEGGVQLKLVATVEVRNADKPALVAECVFRYYA